METVLLLFSTVLLLFSTVCMSRMGRILAVCPLRSCRMQLYGISRYIRSFAAVLRSITRYSLLKRVYWCSDSLVRVS